MNRFSATGLAVLTLLILAGCGGHTRQRVDTGSPGGNLYDVVLQPSPGAVYISRGTTFRLSWPEANPPSRFEAEIVRYEEGDDDSSSSEDPIFSKINRQGNSYVWDLEPDDADLESGGIYFLRLKAGPDEIRTAYIVSDNRAARGAEPEAKETAAGERALRHAVVVR